MKMSLFHEFMAENHHNKKNTDNQRPDDLVCLLTINDMFINAVGFMDS